MIFLVFFTKASPTHGPTDGRTDRRTDGPTDQRTDRPSYKDARMRLKIEMPVFISVLIFSPARFLDASSHHSLLVQLTVGIKLT